MMQHRIKIYIKMADKKVMKRREVQRKEAEKDEREELSMMVVSGEEGRRKMC